MFLIWKIIVVINLVSISVHCQFENQYLGHSFTFEEYNALELGCETTICLRDAQRLLLAATQNKTIEPCEDFKEFSMGQFIKLTALNDRQQSVGFLNDVLSLNMERYRKVLAARVTEKDNRPMKIAKNYYRKCIDSNYIRENATAEMLQHLRSLGGVPFLNASWDENDFNFKEILEKETRDVVNLFLYHNTILCPHPQNTSNKIVCLEEVDTVTYPQEVIKSTELSFRELTYNKTLIQMTAEKVNDFITKQLNLSSQTEANNTVFSITELNSYTNNTFDWLHIINDQLVKESQLTEDSEILIENPVLILKLLELIKNTSKSTLADVFAFEFLYKYKEAFVVYGFDEFEEVNSGTKKSEQRWVQCVNFLYFEYGPALQAFHAKRYYSKEIQVSVMNFTKEVVADFMTNINTRNNFSENVKQNLMEKLSNIKYVIGYPEEVFDLLKIEEYYEELDLDGSEGYIETYLKMYSHSEKIQIILLQSWKKKLHKKSSRYFIKYYTDDNILYIPPGLILYPFYHQNRSRFFNTAILFIGIAFALSDGINDYLIEYWNIEFDGSGTVDLAYDNYVNWEKSGGKELQLPGFFLTNRQMFWVALAHRNLSKFHPHNKRPLIDLDLLENLHIIFKDFSNFRDAFNCSDLTEDEKKKLNLYFEIQNEGDDSQK